MLFIASNNSELESILFDRFRVAIHQRGVHLAFVSMLIQHVLLRPSRNRRSLAAEYRMAA
jgi:hypothetical protein